MDDTNNTNTPTVDEAGTETSTETQAQAEGQKSEENAMISEVVWGSFLGIQITPEPDGMYKVVATRNTANSFIAEAFKTYSDSQLSLLDIAIGVLRYREQQDCSLGEAARVKCPIPHFTYVGNVNLTAMPQFLFGSEESFRVALEYDELVKSRVEAAAPAYTMNSETRTLYENADPGALVTEDVPAYPPIPDEPESWIKLEAALNACGAIVVMKSGGDKPISYIWNRDGVEGEVWIRDGQIVCSGLTTAHQGEYVVSTYAQVGQLVDQIVKDAETAAAIAAVVPKESDEPAN